MTAPINSSQKDYFTEGGSRLSLPIYLDPPMSIRKQVLNAVRERVQESRVQAYKPKTMGGISVTTSDHTDFTIGNYLGMNVDVLRAVLFQRGGLPIDVLIRLQHISGIELLTDKDIKAAFDTRKKATIACLANNPYEESESPELVAAG